MWCALGLLVLRSNTKSTRSFGFLPVELEATVLTPK